MDDQVFDQISRQVGALVSRRRGLRALLAGAVALVVGGGEAEEAAAVVCLNAGALCGPLTGRSCSRCCSNRSRPVGRPIPGRGRRRRCAAARPGPACIPAGQDGCFDTDSCCAGASCRQDGVCRGGACKAPGQACPNGSAACCIGAVCAGNGTCCGSRGGSCASVTDCCGTLECSAGGECVRSCGAGGDRCKVQSDCCFGSICGPRGEGVSFCCPRPGEPCTGNDPSTDVPCCTGGCTNAGVCGSCGGDGASCQNDDDCCMGFTCDGESCQGSLPPPAPS